MSNHYQLKAFFFSFLFLFLFGITTKAQAIRGVLVDNSDQEPLPGATVIIKSENLSTITRAAGYFEFSTVKPGTYALSIHEIGLGDTTVKYTVTEGAIGPKVVIRMRERTSRLKEVVVNARANHESEGSSRKRQQNANNVINVVSAETIKKSPDLNVADVAQRISGISLLRSADTREEYVIVRGLSPRYNNTLINGVKIPSTDDRTRTVPLEIIPSELVGNLVVSKSLTPDMEADAVGGTVNVELKDAPPSDLFEANFASGFNQKFVHDKFYTYGLGPVKKLDPAQRFGHQYQALQSDFPASILKYSPQKFQPDFLGGITFGKRFLHNKLGVVFSASDQNLYSARTGTVNSVLVNPDNQPQIQNVINRNYFFENNHLGLNAKIDYHFTEHSRLSLIATYLRSTEHQAFFGTDTLLQGAGRNGGGTGLVDSLVRSRYSVQNLVDFAIQGKNDLSPTLTLDYTASYADARAAQPDIGSMRLYYTRTNTIRSGYIFSPNSTTHTWQRNFDKDYSGYLNATWKPRKPSFFVEIKAGGLFRSKKRTNYQNTYTLNAIDQANTTAALFTPNFNESTFRIVNPLGSPQINSDNYAADERISAAYVMGIFRLNKLTIIAGVRDELTIQSNHVQEPNAPFPVIYHHYNYNDFFPSVNLKYSLTATQAFRLSYYRGLNRPNYYELVPYTSLGSTTYDTGNPNLVPSHANNFDFRYEYFPGIADLISLGVFYKKIYRPIERSRLATSFAESLGYQNGNTATNMGAEAEIVKFFGQFGISGNYTYINSSELRRKTFYTKLKDANGNYIGLGDNAPFERTPLEGQSKHSANVSFLFRDDKIHLNAQFSVLFQGRRIESIQSYEYSDYYQQNYTTLSFSADKSVGRRLSFFVKLNNLTNAPFILRTEKGFFLQKDYFGQEYIAGLRFRFL